MVSHTYDPSCSYIHIKWYHLFALLECHQNKESSYLCAMASCPSHWYSFRSREKLIWFNWDFGRSLVNLSIAHSIVLILFLLLFLWCFSILMYSKSLSRLCRNIIPISINTICHCVQQGISGKSQASTPWQNWHVCLYVWGVGTEAKNMWEWLKGEILFSQ